jgi:outer membrane PBP1 activator LpoA protein
MRTTFLLLLLVFFLASCAGQPDSPSLPQTAQPRTSAEEIQQLLHAASKTKSKERESTQLKAASLLLQEKQWDLVEQILQSIQPERLPLRQLAIYAELDAKLNIQRGQYQEALAILETPQILDNIDELSVKRHLRLSLLRAEIFALLGSHIASAQQRIYIAPLLDTTQQKANQQALWRSLMYVSMADLQHYMTNTFRGEYQGWLELAIIAKDNQGDLDEQVRQLEDWQQKWKQHPANYPLPGGLELIKKLAANRPKQIALLLPLTGKLAPYGKAVRDGFIGAMYQTREKGGAVPKLTIYDTESTSDFVEIYFKAVNDGAELIIGPLEKERLSQLFDLLNLPVPTLALNRLDHYGEPPQRLIQFGLSPQDEAQQIADIAFLANHRQALIISPSGEWGDKVSQSFVARWEQLGGKVGAHSIYSSQPDYSRSIKQALSLQSSEDRAKRIQSLIGEHIEFFPRRRKDIDMVFLLASPQEARSITPLLAYHYAGDLPIYGTSRVYSGYEDQKDKDINGTLFTDMPWVLNPPSRLQQQISTEINQSRQYQRMYALGADSYQLYPRLRQLEEIPNSRVYGHTGTLKLNQRREIERQLLLAQIRNGKAKLIPIVDQSLNQPTKEGTKHAQEMAY